MKADIAWRVTSAPGRYVPSLKPVETPDDFIHVISLQNGWALGTSLSGALVHGASVAPARRAMNADVAWRVTTAVGRYVPSLKPVEMAASFIHLISRQKGWVVGTSLNGATVQGVSVAPARR